MPCRSMEIVDVALSTQPNGSRTVINLELAGVPMHADALSSSPGGTGTGSSPLPRAAAARAAGDVGVLEDTERIHAVLPLDLLGALLLACGQSLASTDVSLDTIVGSRVVVKTDGEGAVETVSDAEGLHTCEVLERGAESCDTAVTGPAAASPRASQALNDTQTMGDQLWTV